MSPFHQAIVTSAWTGDGNRWPQHAQQIVAGIKAADQACARDHLTKPREVDRAGVRGGDVQGAHSAAFWSP